MNRGITLLSVIGVMYVKVMEDLVTVYNEREIFREDRKCSNQIFVVRQMCEKVEKEKN